MGAPVCGAVAVSTYTLDTISTYAISVGLTAVLFCTYRLWRELRRH